MLLRAHLSGKPGKGFSVLGATANQDGWHSPSGPLGHCVALLAMKYCRAPLPVSRGLEKALSRQGLAEDPAELGDLARRYLFLGDAQMLLAESRKRLAPLNSLKFVKQLDADPKTQWEAGVAYQCP